MTQAITNEQLQKLHLFSEKAADFIAQFEEASERIATHEIITRKRLEESEAAFNARMEAIEKAIAELREFMTQTGAARLRLTAEQILREGEQHLNEIQEANKKFQKIAENSCRQLQHTAESSSHWITDSIKSLRIEDFRRLIFDNTDHVETVSQHAVSRIKKMVKWFHWEKVGIALVVAVIVSLLTGLFINDEAPWEVHKQVVAERSAGQLLIKAWPKLSPNEKEHIENIATEYL